MSEKGPSDENTNVEVVSYEEAAVAVGAPTEKVSPLGYHVGSVSVVFLVRLQVCLPYRIGCTYYRRTSAE